MNLTPKLKQPFIISYLFCVFLLILGIVFGYISRQSVLNRIPKNTLVYLADNNQAQTLDADLKPLIISEDTLTTETMPLPIPSLYFSVLSRVYGGNGYIFLENSPPIQLIKNYHRASWRSQHREKIFLGTPVPIKAFPNKLSYWTTLENHSSQLFSATDTLGHGLIEKDGKNEILLLRPNLGSEDLLRQITAVLNPNRTAFHLPDGSISEEWRKNPNSLVLNKEVRASGTLILPINTSKTPALITLNSGMALFSSDGGVFENSSGFSIESCPISDLITFSLVSKTALGKENNTLYVCQQ